jgi:hypothetical protein
LVSKTASVINAITGKFIKGHVSVNKNWTRTVSFTHNGLIKTKSLHRIVARTFCGRPSRHLLKAYADLEVNHIDGNRSNNVPSNLEWVLGNENVLHSHQIGLCPRDTPVLARCVLTNKITRFHSAKRCADYFGIHRATFFKHLKYLNHGKQKAKNHIFKYDDESNWVEYPEEQIREFGSINAKLGSIVTDVGNQRFVHRSISEASRFHGINGVTVWRNLKIRREFQYRDVLFRFLSDLKTRDQKGV